MIPRVRGGASGTGSPVLATHSVLTITGRQQMPSVFVQGRPVDSYPRLAPEARNGKVRRITEAGEEVLHKPCRDVTEFGRTSPR
jgi:hypothetical protein